MAASPGALADAPGVARLHWGSFAGLFCVGIWATSFGPALPFLADEFGVSLDGAGFLLTVLFLGSITASGAMALWLHQLEARLLAAGGLVVAAIGVAGLAIAPSWPLALASVAFLGFGDGFLVAAAHAAIATTAKDVPHSINRLNLWFAVGAMLGPLWAGAVLSQWADHRPVYAGVSVLALAAAALLFAAPRSHPVASHAPAAGSRANGTVLVMGAVLFLYVGAEIGLGSWVSSYSREAFGAGVMAGALVASGYWGALALGRVASGMLFGRGVAPLAVLVTSITGALAASTVLAAAGGSLALGAAAAFATGLFFGPIWPAAITIASHGSASGAPATMVTVGNAGGILFPWFQGRVLVAAGPSRGIALTAAICAGMLILAASYRRKLRAE